VTHYSTLFDKNYLTRGLALWESLQQHSSNFCLHILCLDDFTFTYLQKQQLENVILTPLATLEAHCYELKTCKNNRSRVEYYFTLSPCFPLYLLEKHGSSMAYICSLDADLYFYDDPQRILKGFENHSILITSHSFAPHLGEGWLETGIFNVSFQAFRNDETGLDCLKKWKKLCIEWCYNHYDPLYDRFADQKYLERFPKLYGDKLIIISHPTANVALWNVNQYTLSYQEGRIYSDWMPLVFYHFSNVKILGNTLVQTGFYWAQTRLQPVLLNRIYLPYIQKLKQHNQLIFNQVSDPLSIPSAGKRFAGLRLALRERGLLFTFDRLNFAVHCNFSWIHNLYETYKRWATKQQSYSTVQRVKQYEYEK
jgi:hypothetical protein